MGVSARRWARRGMRGEGAEGVCFLGREIVRTLVNVVRFNFRYGELKGSASEEAESGEVFRARSRERNVGAM